jgi:hypothetical protein
METIYFDTILKDILNGLELVADSKTETETTKYFVQVFAFAKGVYTGIHFARQNPNLEFKPGPTYTPGTMTAGPVTPEKIEEKTDEKKEPFIKSSMVICVNANDKCKEYLCPHSIPHQWDFDSCSVTHITCLFHLKGLTCMSYRES